MSETLEQVLADTRGDAAVLRKHGDERLATSLEAVADRVQGAAARFLTWLSESDAVLRAGHQVPWLRARFAAWERAGLARWNPRNARERQYLEVVVPLRRNAHAIEADARRAARGETRSEEIA